MNPVPSIPSTQTPSPAQPAANNRVLVAILVVIIVVLIVAGGIHYKNMAPDYYNLSPEAEVAAWNNGNADVRKKIIIAKMYNLYNDTASQFPESKAIDDYLMIITYPQLMEGFAMFTQMMKEQIAHQKANPNANNAQVDKLMQCLSM